MNTPSFVLFTPAHAEDLAHFLSKVTGYIWKHDDFGCVRAMIGDFSWEINQGPRHLQMVCATPRDPLDIRSPMDTQRPYIERRNVSLGIPITVKSFMELEAVLHSLIGLEECVAKTLMGNTLPAEFKARAKFFSPSTLDP